MDSLAAGIVAIAAGSFAILSASFGRADAAVLSAIVCGATLAFLRHNYHPAKIFMGDSGALALGFLLATLAVDGVLKTAAAITLVAPLLVLAVPILDTSFVVLKRLKYRRPPWGADHNHFYHRFMRIGFSQRRTAAYLHLWALMMAAYALLARFVPPRPRGELGPRATRCCSPGVGLLVIAASVWMVYSLEILKARHLQAHRAQALRAEAAEERRRARPRGRPSSARSRPHGLATSSGQRERAAARRGRAARAAPAAPGGLGAELDLVRVARAAAAGPRARAARRRRRAGPRTSTTPACRAPRPRGSSCRRRRRARRRARRGCGRRPCAPGTTTRSSPSARIAGALLGRCGRARRSRTRGSARGALEHARPAAASPSRRGRARRRARCARRTAPRRRSTPSASSTARSGSKSREVVLLLQAGVADELGRPRAVARAAARAGSPPGTSTRVARRQLTWCWSAAHS